MEALNWTLHFIIQVNNTHIEASVGYGTICVLSRIVKAVTFCMDCHSMGYGMLGFNGHAAAHTGSVVLLRGRSVWAGTGPGNVPAWSRDLWQHINGNLHLVRCNYGMVYLQVIMWTFIACKCLGFVLGIHILLLRRVTWHWADKL